MTGEWIVVDSVPNLALWKGREAAVEPDVGARRGGVYSDSTVLSRDAGWQKPGRLGPLGSEDVTRSHD